MAAQEANACSEGNESRGDHEQDAHEAVELALQRAAAPLTRGQRAGNAPEFGSAADRHDDCFATATDDTRAGVGDGVAARERCFSRIGLDPARLGNRLTGQHAAVEQQPLGANDPGVGRDDVARLEQDDVTGYQLRGGNYLDGPSAAHARGRGRSGTQRLEGALPAVLGDHVGTHDRQ